MKKTIKSMNVGNLITKTTKYWKNGEFKKKT